MVYNSYYTNNCSKRKKTWGVAMYKRIKLDEWQELFVEGTNFTYDNLDNYVKSKFECRIIFNFDKTSYSIYGRRYCLFQNSKSSIRLNDVVYIEYLDCDPHNVKITTRTGGQYDFVHNNEKFVSNHKNVCNITD
jgi:hypothetical protein